LGVAFFNTDTINTEKEGDLYSFFELMIVQSNKIQICI